MNIKRYEIQVSGKVQGVYYRASTKDKAVQLGITGYVKNMSDGGVFIDAEGSQDALDVLISWCHQGPTLAHVKQVTVKPIAVPKGYQQFDIRY